MSIHLIRANAAQIPLADESVQCVVTSPPYWGLRKYAGEQELVWGDQHCVHEWGGPIRQNSTNHTDKRRWQHTRNGRDEEQPKEKRVAWLRTEVAQGSVCQKCGAWRGAFGLEPTVEMYVQHTVEILREIRRVLRKDGVCFLNLGDSYAAHRGNTSSKPGADNKNANCTPPIIRRAFSGGKNPNQSHHERRAPACDSDGREFRDWMESGCACSCHDDERSSVYSLHSVHNDQQPEQDVSQILPKAHDNGHSDSSLTFAGDVVLGVPVSNRPASVQSSRENRAVRFCSGCLSSHCLASSPSLSGTLYNVPKAKDLCLIPFRVALAAQADGWWIRSVIIWAKPNPMPESVTDRPTDAYEHILMLTKAARYYWDMDAVLEKCSESTHMRVSQDVAAQIGSTRVPGKTNGNMKAVVRSKESWNGSSFDKGKTGQMKQTRGGLNPKAAMNPAGSGVKQNESFSAAVCLPVHYRNMRNFWDFSTQPYSGAHFATFPEELPRRCIKAASRPSDLVLDPFGGSGTTGRVAIELNRRTVLLDLAYHDGGYVELAEKRTSEVQRGLTFSSAVAE